ncbi:hypothetical protein GCM10008983_27570 [Lentibacillus halophilus]|uniref:Lipoprotein with Yx(FWY)xxD motif n=1 Tax=Lentibacillus halophilus TaxID=295065 RepID=A0ABN0ZHK6_9BACI
MKKWIFSITIVACILILSACGSDSDSPSKDENNSKDESDTTEETNDEGESSAKSLQLLEDPDAGKYLADEEGMTLYLFTKDEKGTSNCTGGCLENWPAFTAEDVDVPEGYNKDDFDTITREDTGKEQVTYKGYPLYYFKKDKEEGDVNGQGKKDVWYVANETSIKNHFQDRSTSLEKGVDDVLTSLEALSSTAEASANDVEKVNSKGKNLSESWEPIEKKVEKRDAEAYENIEESLYPLIDEAQKDKPDIGKIKKLTEETTNKLTEFQKKLGSPS